MRGRSKLLPLYFLCKCSSTPSSLCAQISLYKNSFFSAGAEPPPYNANCYFVRSNFISVCHPERAIFIASRTFARCAQTQTSKSARRSRSGIYNEILLFLLKIMLLLFSKKTARSDSRSLRRSRSSVCSVRFTHLRKLRLHFVPLRMTDKIVVEYSMFAPHR